MKYRILIADDEVKIIQLIQKLGHWEELDMEIVAVCDDGEDAYCAILKLKPDIVLTDIKMPVVDGIEMIQKTKEANIHTHFIVISGFRHFEYARSAIQLGVVDYLLKPLDEVQLNRTLEKTCRLIDSERQQEDKQAKLEQYMELDRADAMEKFWELLTDGSDGDGGMLKSIETCNRTFKTAFREGYFRCAYVATNMDSLLSGRESLFSEKIYESFGTIFGERFIYYSCVRQKGILLVLNYDKTQQELVRQSVSALYYNIKNLTEIYGNFILNIGLSNQHEDIRQLKTAVQEALIAEWGRLVLLGDKVLEYDSIRNLPRFEIRDILTTKMELDVCNHVRYMQLEPLGLLFEEIAKVGARYENFYPGDMRAFIYHLFNSLFTIHMEENEQPLDELRMSMDIYCKNAKNFQQAIRQFYLFLDGQLRSILKKLQEKKGKPVEDACKYIDAHYGDNISLEEISGMLQLSPTYFSRLFKAEMDICFVDYVMQVRLEKAKALLTETHASVKEIAYKVGYGDDKYFSKLFKKQVGIKPTEFRKLYSD